MCTCNHKHRLAVALARLDLEPDDVRYLTSAHDEYCGLYHDECCDCHPRLTLETKGGEIIIGEDGEIKVMNLN